MCDVIYITHEFPSREEHGSCPRNPQVERAQPLLVLSCDFLCDSRSRRLVRALEHCSNIRDVRERWLEIVVIDGVRERIASRPNVTRPPARTNQFAIISAAEVVNSSMQS